MRAGTCPQSHPLTIFGGDAQQGLISTSGACPCHHQSAHPLRPQCRHVRCSRAFRAPSFLHRHDDSRVMWNCKGLKGNLTHQDVCRAWKDCQIFRHLHGHTSMCSTAHHYPPLKYTKAHHHYHLKSALLHTTTTSRVHYCTPPPPPHKCTTAHHHPPPPSLSFICMVDSL